MTIKQKKLTLQNHTLYGVKIIHCGIDDAITKAYKHLQSPYMAKAHSKVHELKSRAKTYS